MKKEEICLSLEDKDHTTNRTFENLTKQTGLFRSNSQSVLILATDRHMGITTITWNTRKETMSNCVTQIQIIL